MLICGVKFTMGGTMDLIFEHLKRRRLKKSIQSNEKDKYKEDHEYCFLHFFSHIHHSEL